MLQQTEAVLEITASTAVELVRLELACIIDIRQPFELDLKGAIPRATHVPFFQVKQALGLALTEEEQEVLDADEPSDLDIRSFIKALNQLRQGKDCILLIMCNSGRRSIAATRLMRELGYTCAFSLQGGYQVFKPLITP